jgi:hypothetical protein
MSTAASLCAAMHSNSQPHSTPHFLHNHTCFNNLLQQTNAQDFELPIESESRDGDSPDVSKLALGPGGVSLGRGISGAPEGMTPLPDLKDVGKKRAKREAEVSSNISSSSSSSSALCVCVQSVCSVVLWCKTVALQRCTH